MAEGYMEAAFEVKTMSDELARALLRWHWEREAGYSFRELLRYVEERMQEDPEYYSRMPNLANKRGWQDLDASFCTRVLLDQETTAAKPVRLLRAAPHPSAARRAVDAVRRARNAAAHAGSQAAAAEACGLFDIALDDIEDAYGEKLLTASALSKYGKAAERCLQKCNGVEPAPPVHAAAPRQKSQAKSAGATPRGRAASPKGKTAAPPPAASGRPRLSNAQWGLLAAVLLVALAGLVLRAVELGML